MESIVPLSLEIANISASSTNKQTKSSILQSYFQNRITQYKEPASNFYFFTINRVVNLIYLSIQFENKFYKCSSSVIFPAVSSEKLITSESEKGSLCVLYSGCHPYRTLLSSPHSCLTLLSSPMHFMLSNLDFLHHCVKSVTSPVLVSDFSSA